MRSTLIMAKTFLKIFSKDRQAIFFTLFFPITFMAIFGFINTGDEDPLKIGIVDNARNDFSAAFVDVLDENPIFEITVGEEDALRNEVVEGEMVLVLVLPDSFDGGSDPADITLLVDRSQVRQTAMVTPVVEQALLDVERELRGTAPLFPLAVVDVQARTQRYIDFLIPGLLALTLMQISIAGSGYNIVEYRRKGILKRLFVTPVLPSNFIGGLVIARLAITVVQVGFLPFAHAGLG
jgi:ABC-2 type transport system permease protein